MKRQIILGTTLAVALTVGAFFAPLSGAVSFADKAPAVDQNVVAAEQDVTVYQTGCELIDESESIKTYVQDLVMQGTISQNEADRLVANEQKMEALFSGLTEELTAEQEQALDERLDSIYQEVADIYQKIDNAYYQEYYNELAENGVLTAAEIEQLKVADKQIEDLYENLNSEDNWAAIEDKEAQIYLANKAIYDKIDAYDEAQYQKEMDQMYQEMVDAGEFTAEQVEQLKAVNAQVYKLLEQAGDDLSEEQWAALDQKINALYEGLDFLDDVEVYEVSE